MVETEDMAFESFLTKKIKMEKRFPVLKIRTKNDSSKESQEYFIHLPTCISVVVDISGHNFVRKYPQNTLHIQTTL